MYLHASKLSIHSKKEVNAATEIGSWRVIPFAPYVPESDRFLKVGLFNVQHSQSPLANILSFEYWQAGDVIRLFHKEGEGYLTNEPVVDEESEYMKEKGDPLLFQN